ncbi:MAG: MFS transporter, partial [Pseudomonadota bacterium]|nr:MFS transporter [Pseudomonadota bacterium]
APVATAGGQLASNVVDPAWVAVAWTLWRAMGTARFGWLALANFMGLIAYYTILVHQTRFLIDVGFDGETAALALGLVGTFGVASLMGLGALSDRWGREVVWTIAMAGYVMCYGLSLALEAAPSWALMAAMVIAQGLIGQGMATCFASMPADLFQGPNFGKIFGVLSLAATSGGAAGPWLAGALYDNFGSYQPAFAFCVGAALMAIFCGWMAAPRRVRRVAGQIGEA